jgi:Ornithine cyclodeaminase/mu-crystallin family
MLGSGGMARSHLQAFMAVRHIKLLQVYSPTRENREAFGRKMTAKYSIEVKVCDRPQDIYKGAHIVAALTDSTVPVLDGTMLEPGTHIVNIGGSGRLDAESLRRIDVYLRFGDAPPPVGHPDLAIDDQFLGWEARPGLHKRGDGRVRPRNLDTRSQPVYSCRIFATNLNHAPRLAFLACWAGARTPSIRPSGSVCVNSLYNALGIDRSAKRRNSRSLLKASARSGRSWRPPTSRTRAASSRLRIPLRLPPHPTAFATIAAFSGGRRR